MRPLEKQYWDIKYYYSVHCQKMRNQNLTPVSYCNFCKRIRKMTLHDAIYMPRVEYQVKSWMKVKHKDDFIRRNLILKDENVQILTFEEIEKRETKHHLTPKQIPMAKYNMKPKKTLLQRFISLFKKPWQKKES